MEEGCGLGGLGLRIRALKLQITIMSPNRAVNYAPKRDLKQKKLMPFFGIKHLDSLLISYHSINIVQNHKLCTLEFYKCCMLTEIYNTNNSLKQLFIDCK